jgi:putative endonuclease
VPRVPAEATTKPERRAGTQHKKLTRGTRRYRIIVMSDQYFVYILASKRNGTLYVGVTNDLVQRVGEHKSKVVPGFTLQYGVDQLVYFEEYESIIEARAREHSMKRWRRAWKIELIEKMNPSWRDLSRELAL